MMSVEAISAALPTTIPLPTANTHGASDSRVHNLWQKMAENLAQKKRVELVKALNAASCPYLNWRQRPHEIRAEIDATIGKLKKDTSSNWGNNGDNEYRMMYIKEVQLIKQIIKDAPVSQKDFYFMDIGAGNFQWGKHLMEFLNQQEDLPKDVKF